jgi:hypothetical protein
MRPVIVNVAVPLCLLEFGLKLRDVIVAIQSNWSSSGNILVHNESVPWIKSRDCSNSWNQCPSRKPYSLPPLSWLPRIRREQNFA